jgi:hypothetical protein
VLEALRESLLVDDLETRFNAAFAANKLAMKEANLSVLGEAGLVPPLVRLAGDPDDCARTQAVSCLRRLALLAENRLETVECDALFLEEDGLRSLFFVARSLDNECQYNAALGLRALVSLASEQDRELQVLAHAAGCGT